MSVSSRREIVEQVDVVPVTPGPHLGVKPWVSNVTNPTQVSTPDTFYHFLMRASDDPSDLSI